MAVPQVVDLRSDTLTLPTEAMRDAMKNADVGDDIYGEDPTVNRFHSFAAKMFQKEDALLVPSGTMANLICVLSHCWQRGGEVMLGDQSHIYKFEQGGIAQIGGVHINLLHNQADGTFSLDDIKNQYHDGCNPHMAKTMLIAIENTINGKIIPLEFLKKVKALANALEIPTHLDGARIMNAAVGLNIDVTSIAKYFDSISICLSKGLGAPVGSVIVGSKDFIAKARNLRKLLGGSMRQCGVLAAPGIIALTEMVTRLHEDHQNAKLFASGLSQYSPNFILVNLEEVQTNMVWFEISSQLIGKADRSSAEEFCFRMKETNSGNISVNMLCFPPDAIRAVFYNGISRAHVDVAIRKVKQVMERWMTECNLV